MNIRNVLKTYANLRQLTDDETALLNTLRSLNDSERELVVQSLQPEKATKKASKKSASKSKRASGMATVLKNTLRAERNACFAELPDGSGVCQSREDDSIHFDAGYGNYHEFLPASTEQSASVSGD